MHREPPGADLSRHYALLILAALTFFGMTILRIIPLLGKEGCGRLFSSRDLSRVQPGGMNPERLRLLGQRIDLNTASVRELSRVKGIGPGLAPEVIKEREKRGGFKNIEELLLVKGMGRKRLLRAGEFLVVRPP